MIEPNKLLSLEVYSTPLGGFFRHYITDEIRRSNEINAEKITSDLRKHTDEMVYHLQNNYSSQPYFPDIIDLGGVEDLLEGMVSQIRNLSWDINSGFSALASAFNTAIGDVIWQLEKQNEILQNILERITHPLKTEAEELRANADEAYHNALIYGDEEWYNLAEECYQEALKKIKKDFIAQFSLGHIYLYKRKDWKKASECYHNAAIYSKPYSKSFAAEARFFKGLAYYTESFSMEIEEAEYKLLGAIDEINFALKLNPEFLEARYHLAKYYASLFYVERDKAIENLRQVILADRGYLLKLIADDDFNRISQEVTDLLSDLKKESKKKIEKLSDKLFLLLKEGEFNAR